jgi:hypothetical protein
MPRLTLREIVLKCKSSPLTEEEEEYFDTLEKEVLLPTFKWFLLGGGLVFYVVKISPDSIGTVMIVLTLYLLIGLMLYMRDMDGKLSAYKKKLACQKILFQTDMITRKKRDLLLIFLTFLALIVFLLVLMIVLHGNQAFHQYWSLVSEDMKSDHYALLFSVFVSLAVIFTAAYRVVETSNLVITDEGIHIGENFYPWRAIAHAEVEYFFMRPLQLIIETHEKSRIRIDLYRFRIDNRRAEEISSILIEHVKI